MGVNFSYGLPAVLMGAAIVVAQPQVAAYQTVDEQAIGSMAKDVTVVINGQNPGSGVIIAKQGNTYYVLSAKHVVATKDEYEIVTSDGKSHPLDYGTVKKLPGVDLAVVQFTSDQNYRVAQLGDSEEVTEGAAVYIAGWPHPGRAIKQRIYQMTKGSISGRPLQALEDGYALVYTNITHSGMSGGSVLDAQGRAIGIHGRAEGEPVYNPDTGQTVNVKSGFNLGIPINTFLKAASQAGINLPYLGDNFAFAKSLEEGKYKVLSVAISPDGQTVASGAAGGSIKLWDRNTGKQLRTFTGHSNTVDCLAVSPDGQFLVSGSRDATLKIWKLRTGEMLRSLTGDRNFVTSVAISPDGKTVASGSAEDANIKIWNLGTGELLRTLKGHSNFVNSVAFSSDGQTLVSGSSDKTVKIWNLGTGELRSTLTGHSNIVTSVATSPYGQILASGSYGEGAIKIWNWRTGELLHTLSGHSQTVKSVAIDPYGHILASGSYDGTVKIWNLHTGQLLRTLEVRSPKGYAVAVFSVAFSAEGQTLVSAGDDGTVRVWQVARR
jgi:WD40 repeat protein/S1-C subfamily serine protease